MKRFMHLENLDHDFHGDWIMENPKKSELENCPDCKEIILIKGYTEKTEIKGFFCLRCNTVFV